jgi:membrane glycosyltransferase
MTIRADNAVRDAAMRWTCRRFLFAASVVATTVLLSAWLASVLAAGGFGVITAIMVTAFAVKATWVVINFWNAVIGFFVLRRGHTGLEGAVRPQGTAVRERIAIAMTVCNEDVVHFVARLRSMKASLDASGYGEHFHYYLLSDSSDPRIIAAETHALAAWQPELGDRQCLVYRRRARNSGSQHGNLYDFSQRFGDDYDTMIVLDADSLMTADAILELAAIMRANPRIGMLQSINSGILMQSLFARIFEFGHRHGMRCWIAGAVWWQGERGQYRGHNAAIRVAPYIKHCSLAELPGNEPFGGIMFSHDQIESILMHRAGYEIRELPVEHGSYEGVPPMLADFTTRYCRWLQGNLRNLRMLRLRGLTAMDRYHIIGVAHRFMAWPAMIVFVALTLLATLRWPTSSAFATNSAFGLYLAYFAIYFTPKILGLIDSAIGGPGRYGGVARLIAGGLIDFLLTLLFVPTAMLTATFFLIGLIFGRTLTWDTQRREGYRLPWSAAAKTLWPHTTVGLAMLAALAVAAPAAIPWFLPFFAGLVLAIPLAVISASAGLSRLAARWRLCALPEDIEVPREISSVLGFEAAHGKSFTGLDHSLNASGSSV